MVALITASCGQTSQLFPSGFYSSEACTFITACTLYRAITGQVNISREGLGALVTSGVQACRQWKTAHNTSRFRQMQFQAFSWFGLERVNFGLSISAPATAAPQASFESSIMSTMSLMDDDIAAAAGDTGRFQEFMTVDPGSRQNLLQLLQRGSGLEEIYLGEWPGRHAISVAYKNPGACSLISAITGGNSHITSLFPTSSGGWCYFNSKGQSRSFKGYALQALNSEADLAELVDNLVGAEARRHRACNAIIYVWKLPVTENPDQDFDRISNPDDLEGSFVMC
ncbi:hypothetical protein ACWJJH_21850 [Endozoicomonadaceae bacterium StTr2]